MKTHLFAALAAATLYAGPGFADTIVIKPEQETVIRQYIQKKPLASIDLPGVEINVGTRLPDTVELHALEVPDVTYQYVVIGDRTVLVDPGTREIVYVMN